MDLPYREPEGQIHQAAVIIVREAVLIQPAHGSSASTSAFSAIFHGEAAELPAPVRAFGGACSAAMGIALPPWRRESAKLGQALRVRRGTGRPR
jgi:hypothetical protein